MAQDQFNLDEILSDTRQNVIGQTGPGPSAVGSALTPSLGVGIGTSAAQGLLGLYTYFKELEEKRKERAIQQAQFNRQMNLQERGQDFRESSYRAESPMRTAQASAGLNNVAGQNMKYLDLIRGIRGIGV